MQQQPILTRKHQTSTDPSSFDQVPIGSGANKFAISQFGQNQTPQIMQSTANMTLQQKLQSKTVKIKLQGLEQLKNLLGDNEKNGQIQIQLSKILKQNNPACLEKALLCAQKWIEIGRSWGEKQIKQIIQNGCVNGKGATKKLANDLIFKLFENRPEEIQRTIIQIGLKGKVPKIVGGYLSILNQLLLQFGIKDLKYLKPYIPTTVNVMNNEKLPIVKAEGMNLFKNGLKWLGKDFLWPLFSELKQNIKKQLQTFWESHDKKQVMKANRAKNNPTPAQKNNIVSKTKPKQNVKNQQVNHDQGLDIYQISDPTQVLQKFDQRWTENVLQAEKWNIKTTLLQELITKANVPKIANTEHRHITQMMRRLINDSNFNVVLTVIKLAGTLAKGLRKGFSHSAKALFPYITPKFRDKKTQMIQETNNTLNNFSYCFSMQQVGQDIKIALKDKTAGMKNNIIKWMTVSIEKGTTSDRVVQFLKSNTIQSTFESLLNDPSADVRDSTAKFVCKARVAYGDGLFKNVDKNISNKDIIQKLNDGVDNEQGLSKSRSKDTSCKKIKSQSKGKSGKNQDDEQQVISKNTYNMKSTGKGVQTVDISEQLNKNLKKLNDSNNWQNRKDSAQKLIKFFNQLDNPRTKIVSAILYDFLSVLRARISDPNKQLIKTFVSLVGQVFRCLPEKQAKIQAKSFLQQLIQALSDKNEVNRKQIYKSFDKITVSIGSQNSIVYLGQILSQQSSNSSNNQQLGSTAKQYTLQYLLNSQFFIQRIESIEGSTNMKQFKQYPKIILSGLCDKNKDLRSTCQRMFKIISQKSGIEVFRNFVNSKDQKITFKGDLIAFLDKIEGNSNCNQQPSMISNGSNLSLLNKQQGNSHKRSPSVNRSKLMDKQIKQDNEKSRRKLSNATSLCNSRSKNKSNSILMGCEQSKDYTSNLSFYLKDNAASAKRVEGSQMFASLEILTSQRIIRQQYSSKYRSTPCPHPISSQLQLQSTLSKLVNYSELYTKMFSQDYLKNLQAANKIIKLCRDVAQTNNIRELYDQFIKWVAIKLYGGNVAAQGIIQIICPVLSILQKKKIAWTDWDVEMLFFVIREYLVTLFFGGNNNLEVIKNILKLAIAISSGERILRKLLQQMKLDMNSVHRHLAYFKREITFSKFYKKSLAQICGCFIDYFSNDNLLGQAANIPQLSQDPQFVRLLANKFHQGVLKQFGFKLIQLQREVGSNQIITGVNLQKSFYNAESVSSISPKNGDKVGYFGGNKNRMQLKDSKTKKLTPQKNTGTINQSHYPPPSPITKTRLISHSVIQLQTKKQINLTSFYKNVGINQNQYQLHTYNLDISMYTQPSPHNPLGSNLLKLYPYNESAIHFFSTLFQPQNQTSDKITTELSTNCNIIYCYLFNTLIKIMDLNIRQMQGPERISIFMGLVQQSIKCGNVFRNLNQQIIEKSIRYTIDQLVFEDQNRNTIQARLKNKGFGDFKSDMFVKGINGIMLRLLDHSFPLLLVNTLLFNLIQAMLQPKNYEQSYNSPLPIVNRTKKIGLLIRCFTRVTNSYFSHPHHSTSKQKQKQSHQTYSIEQDPSCLKDTHINKFFTLLKQYLDVMQVSDLIQFQNKESSKIDKNSQPASTQESIVFCLCKILRVLNKKNLLVKNYQQVKRQKQRYWKDQRVISDFIMVVSGISTSGIDAHNILGNSNYQQSTHSPHLSIYVDEDLKKVIQLLSKNKTFLQGVKELKFYIQQNGGKFDYKGFFNKMNYEQLFIQKVSQQLAKLNSQTQSTQNINRSLNPDIQNKLQRLKMKLQGINNDHSKSINSKSPILEQTSIIGSRLYPQHQISTRQADSQTPKARDLPSRSIEQSQSTQNDLKKRIEQMKNKVNMSTLSTTNKIR